jgi:hypothetical protein
MNMLMFKVFVATTAVLVTASSAMMVWFCVGEEPWLAYTNSPFPQTLKQPVKPGDAVSLSIGRCNTDSRTHTYLFAHALISLDSARPDVVLESGVATVKPGCHLDEARANVLPVTTRPGKYKIGGVTEVNGTLRSFAVPWSSESFEVAQ